MIRINPLKNVSMTAKTTIILFVLAFQFACSPAHPGQAELNIKMVDDKEVPVFVSLAVSRQEKRIGLSGRDAIGFNEGMLFIYGSNQHVSFTMRGARNELDVAFLDSTGHIQEIYSLIIDPNLVYRSSEKCRYALQMTFEWFQQNRVAVGDTVVIPDEIKRIKPIF
ncbi:MAG: DUF192 domain-containing protein [Candidatus Neomarinimicrobiota bacterium]